MTSDPSTEYLADALDAALPPAERIAARQRFVGAESRDDPRPAISEPTPLDRKLARTALAAAAERLLAGEHEVTAELEALDLEPYPDLLLWRSRLFAASAMRPALTHVRRLSNGETWGEALLAIMLAPDHLASPLCDRFVADHATGDRAILRALRQLRRRHPELASRLPGVYARLPRLRASLRERRTRRTCVAIVIACVALGALRSLMR